MKKKKTELISELKTAENLLLEKHEELLTYKDELARLNELMETNEALANELETAKTGIETTTKKLTAVKKELEKSRKELNQAKTTIAKQKKAEETVPTSSYSFRLDIYPRGEETFQSRIEHLLSGDRQSLDGLNLEAIEEFIWIYLPYEDRNHSLEDATSPYLIEEPEATAIQEQQASPLNSFADQGASDAVVAEQESIPGSTPEASFNIQVQSTNSIHYQYTPFELQIQIDQVSNSAIKLPGFQTKLSLYSKNLASGATTLLGVLDESIEKRTEPSNYTLNAVGLPEGMYRIEVISTFMTTDNKPLPVAAMHESTFIQITR